MLPGYHGAMTSASRARLRQVLVAAATAILVLAVAILPFLTPAWLAFAQDRAGATAWTGYSPSDLRTATDALVHDLVFGPPAFDVAIDGEAVLTARERAHLREVRGVFGGLAVLALAAVAALLLTSARRPLEPETWRSIRSGALALVAVVALLGVVAVVAFEPAFAVFHRLFFAGNYTFDPRTDRLVQLFPDQLWFETSVAVGAFIVVLGLAVAWAAGRRAAAQLAATPPGAPGGRTAADRPPRAPVVSGGRTGAVTSEMRHRSPAGRP
jgi:integral membrane protein (TIGR01906 family)